MPNNILFFIVHPSKYYLFRNLINHLLSEGNSVDILITSKDVLETLIKKEGWKYTNIFPKGRKFKKLPNNVGTAINFVRTIWRLFRYTFGKKYDLFITDDLLVYIGKLKHTPTVVFCDDDLSIIKQFSLVLRFADYILAPAITDLGKFNSKKISFNGYKELAYLHPHYFKPDPEVIRLFNPEGQDYYVLRLVLLKAYHDVGRKGIDDIKLKKLINKLEYKGKVFISSERQLSPFFEKYRLPISPELIAHAIYFCNLFIGDSQTMCSEAAVLGVPTIRINDFAGQISVMNEKEEKYGLMHNFHTTDFDEMLNCVDRLLAQDNLRSIYQEKRMKMLKEKEDLTAFMIKMVNDIISS